MIPWQSRTLIVVRQLQISKEGELIALGEKFKIVEKSGNSYFFSPNGEAKEKIKLGVGYDSTRKFLKEDKKISEQILKEIKKKFAEEA
jgi:hypothetical protein